VSVISNVDWEPPQSLTNSAQITLRAPSGKLNVSGFQSLTGIWSPSSPIQSPSEAPGFDYFSFSLSSPIINLNYQTGAAVPLFSFQNNGGCTFLEIIDNQADPFLPPNSLSVNVGNFFSVLGAGIGLNAFQGNSPEYSLPWRRY
jgi:hypothetical protein